MVLGMPGMRLGFAAEKTTLTQRSIYSSNLPEVVKRQNPETERSQQVLNYGGKSTLRCCGSEIEFPSLMELLRFKIASIWGYLDSLQAIQPIFRGPRTRKSHAINLNSFHLQHSKVNIPLFKARIPTLNSQAESLPPHLQSWIYYETHLHHAHRRHAQFNQIPANEEFLLRRLEKRAESWGFDLQARNDTPRKLIKRKFNLHKRAKSQNEFTLTPVSELPFSDEFSKKKAVSFAKSAGPTTNSDEANKSASNENSQGFSPKVAEAIKNKSVINAEDSTAANSVGFSIEANDVGYFAEINVGTPPQKFKVIMDSGSSDFWLSAPQCTNSVTGEKTCNHPSLSANSSSMKSSNQPFKVTYGTGSVSGVLVQENVEIAGLTLQGHTFGGATLESNEFAAADVPFDGLMGTAKSSLSNQKVLTPIETLAETKTISGAFMGYSLGRAADATNIGQVTLGGVDQTKFDGSLTLFQNVNKAGFWEGDMTQASVDGKAVVTGKTAILDTGTSLMVLPLADATAIHAAIPGSKTDGQGGFTVPCTTQVSVSLNMGGKDFQIKPSDLTFQPISANKLDGDCISGITAGNIGGKNQWLVGDVFLKNVYFATDVTNNQIGLAAIKT
ncbi:aspartic peptidase domain-containing protein [Phakopsora pachyrhizi]|uniref:Aspartic peptidase domain-containing protein n=1 Tax=Phakopsora pachyrhizi TaxID=170000 RepID=A0AAV0ARJ8_PHAPC|nr:aspartic peptidase domain-containing protein [Phakopsora pachyrhizi]